MPLSGLAQFLLGQQGFSEGQRIGTPGINPNAPDPRPVMGPPLSRAGSNQSPLSMLSPLNNPFLLNILAQQGRMTIAPGTTASIPSPLGIIGKAALMTQQQEQQKKQFDMQQRLMEATIGLRQAQAAGELAGGDKAPLTELGKINADVAAGRITKEQGQARIDQIINKAVQERFQNTQSLREEFNKNIKPTRDSLRALSAASTLIQTKQNPIADLAAFISTIRSIDNSTVREGELRAFDSMQGLATQLENLVQKAKGEGFSDTLRRDIAETINRLRDPLQTVLIGQQQFYAEEAKKFKLDPTSIVGGANVGDGPIDLGQYGTGTTNPSPAVAAPNDDEEPVGEI